MKIYFAGASTDSKLIASYGVKRALTSYAEPRQNRDRVLTLFPDVLMDSGAFTVFTKGKQIEVSDYISFVNSLGIPLYFNLDVIGNDRATYENYLRMRAENLNPIPVFHYKGNTEFLLKYCETSRYVALGGLVPYSRQKNKLKKWLDYCWSRLKNYRLDGELIRVHGLGLTSQWALMRYPWYSVDSTTWLIGNKFSEIAVSGTNRIRKSQDIRQLRHQSTEVMTTIAKNRTSGDRFALLKFNVKQMLEQERFLTNYWNAKGISWKDGGG